MKSLPRNHPERRLALIQSLLPLGYTVERKGHEGSIYLITGNAARTFYRGYVTVDLDKRAWALGLNRELIPTDHKGCGYVTRLVVEAVGTMKRIINGHTPPRLSPWIEDDHCSFRTLYDTDPQDIANRVAFIEKTPRVRVLPCNHYAVDHKNWKEGPRGDGQECGRYQPSRDWCDERLKELGYELS